MLYTTICFVRFVASNVIGVGVGVRLRFELQGILVLTIEKAKICLASVSYSSFPIPVVFVLRTEWDIRSSVVNRISINMLAFRRF